MPPASDFSPFPKISSSPILIIWSPFKSRHAPSYSVTTPLKVFASSEPARFSSVSQRRRSIYTVLNRTVKHINAAHWQGTRRRDVRTVMVVSLFRRLLQRRNLLCCTACTGRRRGPTNRATGQITARGAGRLVHISTRTVRPARIVSLPCAGEKEEENQALEF